MDYAICYPTYGHIMLIIKYKIMCLFSSFEKRLFSVVVVDDVDVNCNEVAGSESE
jgi:hypothetical protein